MRTNTAATLYSPIPGGSSRAYTRTVIPAVMWQESDGYTTLKYGAGAAFNATVYIPDMSITPKKGDTIIRGVCEIDVDGSAHSITEVNTAGGKKVVTVDRNDFGSSAMHHWEVGLK